MFVLSLILKLINNILISYLLLFNGLFDDRLQETNFNFLLLASISNEL